VFGRGTQRGAPLYIPSTTTQVGWSWGSSDGVRSWGTDTVVATLAESGVPSDPHNYIAVDFKGPGFGGDEVALSGGDSSGGLFVRNAAGVWKLAGINYAVDSFSFSGGVNPPSFAAAVYDARGLYSPQGGSLPAVYIDPSLLSPVPMWSYASRIGNSYSSLLSFVPEPTAVIATLLCLGATMLRRGGNGIQ
jgi:hypothetical protein